MVMVCAHVTKAISYNTSVPLIDAWPARAYGADTAPGEPWYNNHKRKPLIINKFIFKCMMTVLIFSWVDVKGDEQIEIRTFYVNNKTGSGRFPSMGGG